MYVQKWVMYFVWGVNTPWCELGTLSWKGVQDRHNGIFYIRLKPQNGFPLFEIKHLCVFVVLEVKVLVCGRAWGVLCKFGGGAAE